MSICRDTKSNNITVYLHRECTLNCDFCFQKCSKWMTTSKDLDTQKIFESIKSNYPEGSDLQINFTGGELFFSKNVIEKLKLLILDLKQLYNISIVPSTNLIADIHLIFNFIDFLNQYKIKISSLSTSFDFKRRFPTTQLLELWKSNLYTLKEKYPEIKFIVNTIISNEFISVLKSEDPNNIELKTFNEIYSKKISIALQQMSVFKESDFISDDDLKFCFNYFKIHYPNIVFLYNITGGHHCGFDQTPIIYGDGSLKLGCYLNTYNEDIKTSEIKKLYEKYNKCILCKRYGKCQHECYMEWYHQYKNSLNSSKCFYKKVGII